MASLTTQPNTLAKDDREEAILLLALIATANASIAETVSQWAEGTGVWSTASKTITGDLLTGYAEAHRLGRSLAGDTTPDADLDMAAAVAIWNGADGTGGESRYWNGLCEDVRAGRYGTPGSESDPPKTDALTHRCQSYTRRFRMAAYAGWCAALPEGALIAWTMGDPKTEHCELCPVIADGGPYTVETLPTLPGAEDLPCQSSCLCSLSVEDANLVGF